MYKRHTSIQIFILLLLAGGLTGAKHVLAQPPPAAPHPIIIVGTNTLADAAAVNAAIEQSPEGSEIILRGTFLLNETIRLRGNRSYRGESHRTVLRQADGVNLVALMASDGFLNNTDYTGEPLTVRNLTLDGNRKGNPEAATTGLILRSWNSVVEGLRIVNMGGDGLRLTNLSLNGTGLKTTQVNGRIVGNFIERSGRHGIFVEDTQNACTDWILADNWISSSGADGIHLDNTAGWNIERNHIYGVGQNALYAHRLFAAAICNNYIEDFGASPEAGIWHGLFASLQGSVGSVIAFNRIFNFGGEKNPESTYRYLSITVNYNVGTVNLLGNILIGPSREAPRGIGLYFMAPEDKRLVVVSAGNVVENMRTKQEIASPNVTLSAGL